MRILNFGSLNWDKTYRVPHFVRGGETICALALTQSPGGKGLNQSVALGRAGADVAHAGAVGADGAPLPMGLSLSICPDAEALPVVTLEVPASLEALPDEVTVVGGETIVSLK